MKQSTGPRLPARFFSAPLFFWRLVESQDVASRDASGYERGGQSEPDNYLCNRQRFAHTSKPPEVGFATKNAIALT